MAKNASKAAKGNSDTPELSATEKQQLEAVGIDWKNLDLTKLFSIIQLIMKLFANQVPVMQGHDGGAKSHESCCLATMKAQMEALNCSMAHYELCCSSDQE